METLFYELLTTSQIELALHYTSHSIPFSPQLVYLLHTFNPNWDINHKEITKSFRLHKENTHAKLKAFERGRSKA